MIRNIVFDVGKVLVSYEPDAYMESLGLSAEMKARILARQELDKFLRDSN